MIDLEVDEDWDAEIAAGATAKGFNNIRERLLSNNLVAYSNGNTYIYLTSSKYWAPFVSAEVQVQLCGIVGSDNVSVNYLGATIPYVNFLEKHAIRAGSVPTSICIGEWRLAIYLNEESGSLMFRKVAVDGLEEIVPVAEGIVEKVGSFSVMPCTCSLNKIPRGWSPGGRRALYNYLAVLFPESKRLATVMWIIGNCIIDPSSISKFLLLYGPGGSGKSTVIRAIETILKGCCSTIKPSTFTDPKDDISIETAKAIASNRVLTAGDINLESSKLNLHNIKIMTGHDSIAVPPMKVTTRCSIIAGCNNLPNPRIQPTWMTTAITRRAVVVLMRVKASLIPKREMPDSIEDTTDFLCESVKLAITNPSMPIIEEDMFYTLLGDEYNHIKDKIDIVEATDEQEILDCNTKLDIFMKKELHSCGELASLISADTVVNMGTLNFIKGFRLKEELQIDE